MITIDRHTACDGGGATSATQPPRQEGKGPGRAAAAQTTRHTASRSAARSPPEKTNAAEPVADPGATRRGAIERNFDVRIAHRGRVARLPVLPRFTNSRSVNFAEGADQLSISRRSSSIGEVSFKNATLVRRRAGNRRGGAARLAEGMVEYSHANSRQTVPDATFFPPQINGGYSACAICCISMALRARVV